MSDRVPPSGMFAESQEKKKTPYYSIKRTEIPTEEGTRRNLCNESISVHLLRVRTNRRRRVVGKHYVVYAGTNTPAVREEEQKKKKYIKVSAL